MRFYPLTGLLLNSMIRPGLVCAAKPKIVYPEV